MFSGGQRSTAVQMAGRHHPLHMTAETFAKFNDRVVRIIDVIAEHRGLFNRPGMTASTPYVVSVQRAAPRTIAAVRARLAASQVPLQFRRYLDQVYAARSSGLQLDGQNVFLYRDASNEAGSVDVDFGVGMTAAVAPTGSVRAVELPTGEVATTTHRGSYTGLGAAHDAVKAWCRGQSRVLAGPRWEVYGHWSDDEPPVTDVYYLLRDADDNA